MGKQMTKPIHITEDAGYGPCQSSFWKQSKLETHLLCKASKGFSRELFSRGMDFIQFLFSEHLAF
jgi:hypothetical protein